MREFRGVILVLILLILVLFGLTAVFSVPKLADAQAAQMLAAPDPYEQLLQSREAAAHRWPMAAFAAFLLLFALGVGFYVLSGRIAEFMKERRLGKRKGTRRPQPPYTAPSISAPGYLPQAPTAQRVAYPPRLPLPHEDESWSSD